MEDICIFQRVEKKYLLDTAQRAALMSLVRSRLVPDKYGKSTIQSLYLDTPDHRIIRNSLDAKAYKEKLRLRSYGTPGPEDRVFLELKKKYKGVVYKRRVAMTLRQAETYFRTGQAPLDSQIMREIDYAMDFYARPQPAMLIAYDREAWYALSEPGFRLTFDGAARYRDYNLSLSAGSAGTLLLPEGQVIMELKTAGAMPLWMAEALDTLRIRPASFSKYGSAYEQTLRKESKILSIQGGNRYVSNF